ncbi:DUF262 domain-containing protein [Curtobacterium sp. HSID17257]|uniref:DUF262 domain-containing protein n=1 Tax=Curtobacterium sp. HSID17257 TaxID=2419510 RepID=UPI0013869923|nr:DUF262 domain-containing protein [Curtobacterium sp. HSID17257]
MHAAEINVEELFKSDNQLTVPLWQRRYAWQRDQWAALWSDLMRVEEASSGDAPISHFVGSVVLHAQEGTGLPFESHRYLIVDGQQRITTLTILICAIRDQIARQEQDGDRRDQVITLYTSRYLRNTNLADDHQERLVLQQPDRTALSLLVNGGERTGTTLVEQAYEYFSAALSRLTSARVQSLIRIIAKRLTAVWVVLEPGDNAHRVFQTLNSGGRQLDQSDLVRNYFFLLLGEDGDEFYDLHWKHLESDIPQGRLQSYLAAWSVSQGFAGSKSALFAYFQDDLGGSEHNKSAVLEYGKSFVKSAALYRHILFPEEWVDVDTATRGTLKTLARWGTEPAEGLLLYLLRAHQAGTVDDAELGTAGELILSYLARRFLAGYAPNRHRSIFVRLAQKLRERDDLRGPELVKFLRALLSELDGDNAWPTDAFLAERAIGTPLYTPSRTKWVFIVLERINAEYFDYKANVPGSLNDSSYTVEHILPQRPSTDWESDLLSWGVGSVQNLLETHKDVLGNLTLSATNSQLGNKSLAQKQNIYKDDTLRLNLGLITVDRWDAARINQRGQELIYRAGKAFAPPLSKQQIASLGFFDSSRDSLGADVSEDSDEESNTPMG